MASQDDTNELVLKFPEWQVNLFDVDCTGQFAALAVQKWIAIISLDHPSWSEFGSGEQKVKAKRKLGTHNKYETKALHWNPTTNKQNLLAATNHQKIDVWDSLEGKMPSVSIKAHTRPVSDLSWSSTDPNLLASCAVDSYVHIWDIRDSKRPQVSFKTLGGLNSGASLVQWNKCNGNVLASAHDSDIRIWDMKKPATVSACISAHMNKIHDLDWSFKTDKHLTTCSHDATVKFWDIQSSREPQSTIKAGTHPIWRARNYPFGRGVAMALVPAVHSGDSRVFIYSRTNLASPVTVLNKHNEAVVDLQWRRFKGDCQLMSLSKDKTLRIWSLSEQLQEDLETDLKIDTSYIHIEPPATKTTPQTPPTVKAGIEAETSFGSKPPSSTKPSSSPSNLFAAGTTSTSTPKGILSGVVGTVATPNTPSLTSNNSSFFSPSPSDTLAHEFNLLTDIHNLTVEEFELSQRSCTIKLEQGSHIVRMMITFPSHYPNGAAPSFNLDSSTTIDITSQQELIKVVTEAAYANVRMNRACLEICLRKLAKTFESFLSRPEPPPANVKQEFNIKFGKLDDDRIPFPRTSGARFCSNGLLICFSCPMLLGSNTAKTPKSLDMLNTSQNSGKLRHRQVRQTGLLPTMRTGSGSNLVSLGQSYLQLPANKLSPKTTSKDGGSVSKERTGRRTGDSFSQYYMASICDVSSFLPIDYNLAKSYSLAGETIKDICTKNATVATSYNRPDLVQAWTTVYLIVTQSLSIPKEPDEIAPWPMHPFGRQLLTSLFGHYAKLHDVQTLAMLACVCQLQCQHVDEYFKNLHRHSSQDPSPSPVLTPHPENKLHHSSTDSFGDWDMGLHDNTFFEDTNHEDLLQHTMNCKLLDETMSIRCNEYRRAYADILYRWELLTQRSEVVKYHSFNELNKENILIGQCRTCHEKLEKPFCTRCGTFALTCVVCNVAVKGCSNLCLSCGHGGHTHHLMDWFSSHSLCASGCGCMCLEASGWSQ